MARKGPCKKGFETVRAGNRVLKAVIPYDKFASLSMLA
jgi:hypothetical protein